MNNGVETKLRYSYFVSYTFIHPVSLNHGTGMTNLILKDPVKTMDDVLLFKKMIEDMTRFRDVVIINYKLLNDKGI